MPYISLLIRCKKLKLKEDEVLKFKPPTPYLFAQIDAIKAQKHAEGVDLGVGESGSRESRTHR